MTSQTVSICNCRGGVALDAKEAESLADLLEWADHWSADSALHMQDRARLRRVIRVLRGEAPANLGELA